MTPAQRAAAAIREKVQHSSAAKHRDKSYEDIITEAYAERDAAVAELIDCAVSAIRCKGLCDTCRSWLKAAIAALEGK